MRLLSDSSRRCTKYVVATPILGQVLEEIEVTDPAHPLFGRRFKVHSGSGGDSPTARIFVFYRDDHRLMILREATNLSVLERIAPRAKLSTSAVQEFLALVKEYELCRSSPAQFGSASVPLCEKKSSRK
jgi:hypothetical protein